MRTNTKQLIAQIATAIPATYLTVQFKKEYGTLHSDLGTNLRFMRRHPVISTAYLVGQGIASHYTVRMLKEAITSLRAVETHQRPVLSIVSSQTEDADVPFSRKYDACVLSDFAAAAEKEWDLVKDLSYEKDTDHAKGWIADLLGTIRSGDVNKVWDFLLQMVSNHNESAREASMRVTKSARERTWQEVHRDYDALMTIGQVS